MEVFNRMRIVLIITLFLGLSFIGATQNTDSLERVKVKWINSARMGMIFDSNSGVVGRLSTRYFTGVEVNKFIVGVGIGLDDYEQIITAPMYIELKYKLSNSANTLFLYSQGGYSLPIQKRSNEHKAGNGGVNMGAGFGYQWKVGGVTLFCMNGIQLQRVSTIPDIYYDVFWYNDLVYPQSSTEVMRKMRRAVFLIGINF
ncbi:MAG: hypothetical protein OEX22_07855 [Cyclobacteriaceae bacterium]|nr:hypothetical protein [Cyclobacteriaceae bacterium]